ncbi:hypothetical protein BZL30_3030 [Mycobacterium kansasii]|uniref:Uncharacterized protein n=1 Tax=Mycobacterium kansasii TaxID=1768 RepID=A0A1V3XK40_MYCKA|nr:hypothetical protein BZL30_3030 [Mycobacterium kansasii]
MPSAAIDKHLRQNGSRDSKNGAELLQFRRSRVWQYRWLS